MNIRRECECIVVDIVLLIQSRKDFKKIDHCNKQLGFEMKTLDHEILAITVDIIK
jgi:hypothetical protein